MHSSLKYLKSYFKLGFGLLLGLSIQIAGAETQRTFLYQYDEAGNLISVQTIGIAGAPIVDDIQPPLLRQNTLTHFVVTGQNLQQSKINGIADGFFITNLTSTSNNQLEFDLFSLLEPLETTDLIFTNLLGSDTRSLTIAERLRIISTNPSPLFLTLGQTASIAIRLDEPFTSDKQFQVGVTDSSVAQLVSASQFTLLAGQAEVDISVNGVGEGQVTLNVTQIDDSLTNTINISVVASVPLGPGTQFVIARRVGVKLQRIENTEASVHTKSIGVSRPVFIRDGETIESKPVGVEFPEQ